MSYQKEMFSQSTCTKNNSFQHTLKENQSSSSLLRNFIKIFTKFCFQKISK